MQFSFDSAKVPSDSEVMKLFNADSSVLDPNSPEITQEETTPTQDTQGTTPTQEETTVDSTLPIVGDTDTTTPGTEDTNTTQGN